MAGLENKVRELLDLLDEVERGFQEEPRSVEPQLAHHLVERLEDVIDLVTNQYGSVEGGPLDDFQSQVQIDEITMFSFHAINATQYQRLASVTPREIAARVKL